MDSVTGGHGQIDTYGLKQEGRQIDIYECTEVDKWIDRYIWRQIGMDRYRQKDTNGQMQIDRKEQKYVVSEIDTQRDTNGLSEKVRQVERYE